MLVYEESVLLYQISTGVGDSVFLVDWANGFVVAGKDKTFLLNNIKSFQKQNVFVIPNLSTVVFTYIWMSKCEW